MRRLNSMKRVRLIKDFECCFGCPYHSGGRSLGSPLYCRYFEPARQITDSNGKLVTPVVGNFIAEFCELPDEVVVDL